jgi:hypothetical protein
MVLTNGREALDDLYWRAEILQALYWMHGEGLAADVAPTVLAEFLVAEPEVMADQMRRLAADDYLEAVGSNPSPLPTAYRLTPLGMAEGGRSFRDEFAGLTRPAHGECGPTCWCKDPDRAGDPCPSEAEPPDDD